MWKLSKRRTPTVQEIREQHERERTSLQTIFYGATALAISFLLWYCFNTPVN